MKLIETVRAEYYGADIFVYEFDNGLRAVVTHKANSEELYAGVVFKGGSMIETQLKVPTGTVHFLEHLLSNSPSDLFPTAESKRNFIYGDASVPTITKNGATSPTYMWMYSNSHVKGRERIFKMLEGYLRPDKDDYLKEIEKQRSIILSEKGRKSKKELDSNFQLLSFLFGDFHPEIANHVLGEEEDIKSISIEDILTVRKELFKGSNAVIAIQTNLWPDPDLEKDIANLASYFDSGESNIAYEYREITNNFDTYYMHYPNMKDILLDFNSLSKRNKNLSDEEIVIRSFTKEYFGKCLNEYLRQEKKLVYEVRAFRDFYATTYENNGFLTTISLERLEELLIAIDELYESFWREYLYSEQGTAWFNGEQSDYIFKRTVNYDVEYALYKAQDKLQEVRWALDYSNHTEIAKKLTKKDIEDYFQKTYIDRVKKVFIRSNLKEEVVMPIFKKSKLYDRLSKQK